MWQTAWNWIRRRSINPVHVGPCRHLGGKVFSFWKALLVKALLAVLMVLFGVVVRAQPQAPIEWGEARLLMNPSPEYGAWEIFSHGDTLVLVACRNDSLTGNDPYPFLRVSPDDGRTWSPWRMLGELGDNFHTCSAEVAFTSGAILCRAETHWALGGFYRTTDLGWTWTRPDTVLPWSRYYCSRGDTLFCDTAIPEEVTWTADEGRTYAPSRAAGFEGVNSGIHDLSVSSASIHVVSAYYVTPGLPRQLHYTHAPLWSGPFAPVVELNTNIHWTIVAQVEAAEDGTVIILSSAEFAPPAPDYSAILMNVSRDDGLTWSPPDTLTPFECAAYIWFGALHLDRSWFVYWYDTTRLQGMERGGLKCRFSANNAQAWYPTQPIEATGWSSRWEVGAELRREWVRVQGTCGGWNGETGSFFLRWQGAIHRDSLPPAIFAATQLAPVLPGDTTVTLSVTAADNDSLWQMRMVLRRQGQADSVLVPLPRCVNQTYEAQWRVPPDTADWLYYYRAEDMWENVSHYPSEGPADPWTFHVGPLASESDSILHPSSFVLSAFPNPFNATTEIRYVLPHAGHISLRVYDMLGREVAELADQDQSIGEYRTVFEAAALPSGVYLLRLQSGAVSETRKLLLLK